MFSVVDTHNHRPRDDVNYYINYMKSFAIAKNVTPDKDIEVQFRFDDYTN